MYCQHVSFGAGLNIRHVCVLRLALVLLLSLRLAAKNKLALPTRRPGCVGDLDATQLLGSCVSLKDPLNPEMRIYSVFQKTAKSSPSSYAFYFIPL